MVLATLFGTTPCIQSQESCKPAKRSNQQQCEQRTYNKSAILELVCMSCSNGVLALSHRDLTLGDLLSFTCKRLSL